MAKFMKFAVLVCLAVAGIWFAVSMIGCSTMATPSSEDVADATTTTTAAGGGGGDGDVVVTTSTTGTTVGGGVTLTNILFIHHSVGGDLVVRGNVRGHINAYNASHGTSFAFWDHSYGYDTALRNPAGTANVGNYNFPGDNTDVEGYYFLWTAADDDWLATRNSVMTNHQVIVFKSCYPNSDIPDAARLNQYKTWYLAMRDYFDAHREKLFIVLSTPPRDPAERNFPAEAANARALANWLKSSAAGGFLNGDHPNIVCFDIFNYFAKADDGSADANMLKAAYRSGDGSHPNELADATVGPIFAQFLIDSARAYGGD